MPSKRTMVHPHAAVSMLDPDQERLQPKRSPYVTLELMLRKLPLHQRRLLLMAWDALSAIRLQKDKKLLTEALRAMNHALEATDRRELTPEDDDARFRIGKLLPILRAKRQAAGHRDLSAAHGRRGPKNRKAHRQEITDDSLIAEWPKLKGLSETDRARVFCRNFKIGIDLDSICRRVRRLRGKGLLPKTSLRRGPRKAAK